MHRRVRRPASSQLCCAILLLLAGAATRWGTWSRGGMAVEARDALYLIREPWSQCQLR